MEEDNRHPLLSRREEEDHHQSLGGGYGGKPRSTSFTSSFTADADDIEPINDARSFFKEFSIETKKLWYIAGPAIFTSVCQYSLGAITQVFSGHIGTLELAAVSIQNFVISGFTFGVLLGMGSALETLCGQAFGAGQLNMMGIYMQRSWIVLIVTGLILSLFYIFAEPILLLIGQTPEISKATGVFCLYMVPEIFAYAMNFPIAKFLQAQSKIMVMAAIAAIALVLHTFFSWLFVLKLGWGLVGAAVVMNTSWWFIVVAQLLYIFSGTCGEAWSGFSWKAFHNLWGFVKLSLASAIMLCLELWYFMALIIFAGYLKNAQVSVDAMSICMNILDWTIMVSVGMNAAISVRISNELGAAHPRTAKFSVVVAVVTSFICGLLLALLLIVSRNQYPAIFSIDTQVQNVVKDLTPVLAVSILINNIQPTLSGVAIGAGWQAAVAYVNIACYYVFGIPLGLVLGYKLNMGITGIWYGMLAGTVLQTGVIFWIVYRTNWNKEASLAGDRIKEWGG
ncbi:protein DETOXIFICATION 30-like [Humulus lupulus]|uniref:protein DETOXIFICATION 30-like n=1 Tax=Humulus lupulus TaxID=3486 RepID=UPI002B4042C4|nr:protein DETOXIFICATION 30-like [Humulus lupulus]